MLTYGQNIFIHRINVGWIRKIILNFFFFLKKIDTVGVRFRSFTNWCVTRSSVELKPRNRLMKQWCSWYFRRKICLDTTWWLKKGGWHRCGTYQMDFDDKVSNDIIKIENEWEQMSWVTVSNGGNNEVNAKKIAEK